MSAEVIILPVDTTLDLPAERILDGARDGGVTDILLVGYDPDGEFYMASQSVDIGKLLILLERARAMLLSRIIP